ncbi:MAG: LamG domain-containing protein [Moorea sp. SIOASIH]|uniref:LamG-like jellyroll fold domain-containing protein n=1 Tax=Moorena sp. SIOASIH TaxID=2607817 RepID=UPI0013BBBFFE|nr:LamG-like jellyroll fold domain-containing protein [Moorena sp. SIOASIH]NEO36537.1 LamG domain-containing protein [Moorena sp. SIOASIH]
MYLLRDKVQFVNTIAHEGKVVVVATDTDGKIWYTIKQDGFEDSYLNTPEDQRTGWEDWQELEFPNEAQDDQSVIDKETKELTHQAETSTFILRTRYRTQNQSAAFPVQLVSATGHLYVFRQSKANSTETTPNTLLVDRFVLDGMTNQLVRKLDVRFKRSRQKYQPIASMKKNANGGLSNIDSLDFRDADGKPFYEPTTELTLIENLHQGGFSVVLLPTNEHDNYRWHIFAYNSHTQKVELTSIRASAEGLFDVKDYTVLEPRPEAKNALIPRSIPGIIKRKLDLNGVEVANGLSATKYDIQKEQQTKDGMQLLKNSTKVMVAIPTTQGNVATLSFAVAADGTLSEIDANPDNTNILRSQSRDLLLPLNTLDEIKAIGDSTPPPQAQITGIERGYEDKVQIVSSPSSGLKTGDTVKIANTQNYNGHYQVISIDGDTFEIAAEWVNSEIGSWEVVPKTETGLVFDGIITEVERVADGKLQITALNHGLEAGDEVQIVDTTDYNGSYGVTKIDDENFTINDLFWKPGEAVNLKLESRKRRGVMFDGADEYIKTPALELTPPSEEFSFGYTCSAWVYVSATGSGEQIILGEEDEHIQLLVNNGTVALKVKCANGVGKTTDTTTIPTGQWVHYAGIISSDAASDKTILTLCKNGQPVGIPTEVASLFDAPENWQPEFLIGKSLAGKIADVQVWDKVRTAKEIKDSMYMQLTGREVDLVGYWRLGAITEDKERTVVDFSVYGNDGTVYGDAFVSAITLNRTLGDGTTQAVKYSNDDLVAVSARATYIETFEFKTNPNLNPNNVDRNNGKLFTFSYWGKKSRSAKKRIEQKLFTIDTSDFQSLGNNWYKATCRFTVPDGVAMIRSFELGHVQGTWSTLEIRKHRVQLVSDSITEVNYTDSVSLSTLADNYAELPGQLKTLEQKEREETALIKEKRKLEDKLAQLGDLPRLRQEIAALETEVASLQQQEQTLKTNYEQEVANPLNDWCYIENTWNNRSGQLQTFNNPNLNNTGVYISEDEIKKTDQQWKFVSAGEGYYYIKNKYTGDSKILQCTPILTFNTFLLSMEKPNNSPRVKWKLVSAGDGYYYIHNKGVDDLFKDDERRYLSIDTSFDLDYLTMRSASQSTVNKWKLDKQEPQNIIAINTAQSMWEEKKEQLKTKAAELEEKQETLNAGESTKQAWEDRLKEVIEQLNQVQSELNTANNTVIKTVSTTQQTPQTLPTLHTVSNGSQKGLITKGALLGFTSPVTRIAAIETCEGNVQLSYFDSQGRMRQTNFDATSDSRNTTFEQWLPDELPVALNFADSGHKIQLVNSVALSESWTVEAWFYSAYASGPAQKILLGSKDGDSPVVIQEMSKLGTLVDGVFYDSGYNLERLTPGWHHLAAVGKDSTTIFYIDGRQVADVKQAFLDAATDDSSKEQRKTTICKVNNIAISTIGNSTRGSEQFGKLAEVRVWNLALSEAEIAVNSKTRLSGNEPGLVAYYPLNEGTGTQIRDMTGSGNNSQDTSPAPISSQDTSSAPIDNKDINPVPIGNLGNMVMQFDGVNDYIAIAAHKNPTTAITVSLWAKSNTENWNHYGCLASKRDAYVIHPREGIKAISFYLESNGWKVLTHTPSDIKQWHHYAVTFDGKTQKLYIDGVEVASDEISTTTAGLIKEDTGELLIGKDDGPWSRYFSGQIAEVRVWNKARSAEEIQADMHQRLTGKESGLVGYWQLNHIQSEGDQQKVLDLTGNNNGTVHGGMLKEDNSLPIHSNTVIGAISSSSAAAIGNLVHKVMQFDGVDDYLSLPANISSKISNQITLEAWVYCNTLSQQSVHRSIVTEVYPGSNRNITFQLCLHGSDHRLQAGFFNGAWKQQAADSSFPMNQWVHVAASYDGVSIKIYQNGSLIKQSANLNLSLPSNTHGWRIGRRHDSGNATDMWNGRIAEVRIWNKARTAQEIKADMHQSLTGKESGLVGYWQLNQIQSEGNTIKVLDLTGNNNHGTVHGAILKDDNTLPISSNIVTSASWWGCAAPIGNLGHKVMQFDGVNDYVEISAHKNPTSAITVSLWAKSHTENWNQTACLASKRDAYVMHPILGEKSIQFFIYSNGWQYVKSTQPDINQWHHYAGTFDGKTLKLYIDGVEVASKNIAGVINEDTGVLCLGRDDGPSQYLNGQIAEVRIWNKARSAEEIQADMYQRLTGKESGLVGYWQLNHIEPEGDTIKVLDQTGNNNHGTVHGAILKDDNTLPIGSNALVSAEYSTITIDKVTNQKSAIMQRFFAYPALNGVELLPDKRIEELELKWIGNAQFAPTLLGYIEGAPPVPSENLTVQIDYNGAASVELTTSEDVEFSWYRSQDVGRGASLDAFLGGAGEVSGGVGVESQIAQWKAGFKGNRDSRYQWQNQSNITSSSSLRMTDSLELRGSQEPGLKFSHLGKRFIPKNVGYALVVSSLADMFITRLKRSHKMIGYQVQPVDGIPPDVNTITFLINPAYTMSGSLDGMTGSSGTSDRFFRHVPEMRAQYGSLYPASYYRLQEAYDLKQKIENEDKRRESYFAQYNAGLVDESSLNREIESGKAPTEIGVTREEDKPDENMTEEEKQAAQERRKQQIEQEGEAAADKQSEAAQQKQKEINAKISDQEKRAHATDSFAGWQKRMEDIQIRAGKRNIVNTYVWDADGGMRTEAQSFANTVEHTVGGSFMLDAGLGFQGDFTAGIAAELTALVTINLTQTMNKTENRSTGLELNVDLSGVESIGITDYNDYPIQPGEKVDRYRFMSFYLESSTKNFNDFFSYVVDPEWLASNDEEARALRQARGKANKTWRVLHRVTYVERPALMGFGRDIRPREDIDTITREVVNYFDLLEFKSEALQSDVDRILAELRALKQMLGNGQ